jgi:choline dehydrogenase-like flavoprotein
VKAAMKAIGFVEGEDVAYWKPTGGTMGIPRVTTEGGRRASSTSVYLKPVLESNSNIQLWIDTDVREIKLSDRNEKATGLKVKREGVEEDIAIAEDGLIVVSGGGVKTPQLLLQSGIGPDANAKVVNDAVGKSLSDKPMTWLAFDVPGVEGYNLHNPPEADQKLFAEEGAGPLAQFGPLLVGFIEVAPEITDPKVYPTDKFQRKNLVEFFVPTTQDDGKVKVFFVHLTPHQSANSARIHSNMTVTGEQWDADYSTKSTDYAMDVIKKAMAGQNYGLSSTGSEPWHHNMNHPGGTCELGECVDSETLIVKGLENVGVCDNSLVPEQATVHTAHTLMGIALHCSDILTDFLMADNKDIKDEL